MQSNQVPKHILDEINNPDKVAQILQEQAQQALKEARDNLRKELERTGKDIDKDAIMREAYRFINGLKS